MQHGRAFQCKGQQRLPVGLGQRCCPRVHKPFGGTHPVGIRLAQCGNFIPVLCSKIILHHLRQGFRQSLFPVDQGQLVAAALHLHQAIPHLCRGKAAGQILGIQRSMDLLTLLLGIAHARQRAGLRFDGGSSVQIIGQQRAHKSVVFIFLLGRYGRAHRYRFSRGRNGRRCGLRLRLLQLIKHHSVAHQADSTHHLRRDLLLALHAHYHQHTAVHIVIHQKTVHRLIGGLKGDILLHKRQNLLQKKDIIHTDSSPVCLAANQTNIVMYSISSCHRTGKRKAAADERLQRLLRMMNFSGTGHQPKHSAVLRCQRSGPT